MKDSMDLVYLHKWNFYDIDNMLTGIRYTVLLGQRVDEENKKREQIRKALGFNLNETTLRTYGPLTIVMTSYWICMMRKSTCPKGYWHSKESTRTKMKSKKGRSNF